MLLLMLAQVREKEDRHQQQKISGFLQPLENIQAAREAAAAADMEVRTGQCRATPAGQGRLSCTDLRPSVQYKSERLHMACLIVNIS